MRTYLDYNATAKVRPEAMAAVLEALELSANPSSVHAQGRDARALVERARQQISDLVGASPEMVTFVSGGTEANALAIESARAAGYERVIVGATEHDAVWASTHATWDHVEVWPVDASGVADLDWLSGAFARGGPAAVCLMAANNETGVLQPVAEAAILTRAAGGWLHVDAVQAAGKIPLSFNALGADTLTLSAHKLGGPQGVGALIAGPRASITRRVHGGGQERGRRAGTENVPGIAGFGAAAQASNLGAMLAQSAWRDALADSLRAFGTVVLGEGAPRLPQTLCVATPGFSSQIQVMSLDLAGVMISAGAACSSGKVKPSRALEAMGHPDLASSSIRVSGGWASTEDDWRICGEAWLDAFERRPTRVREYA